MTTGHVTCLVGGYSIQTPPLFCTKSYGKKVCQQPLAGVWGFNCRVAITWVMTACDKEVEVDASHKTFGVIGVRVAPSVVHILLSHLEVEVDDLEWVVTRMKAESGAELPSKATGIIV